MAQKFPLEIKTTNNYQAKITNPESGHYHFEVTYPTAYEPFDWFDASYKGPQHAKPEGQTDNIEQELLQHFESLLS